MVKTKADEMRRIATVRVRGKVHVRGEIEDTLRLLKLNKVNHCVILDNRPQYKGMLNKVKDYITWGEINTENMENLLVKRGRMAGDKRINIDHKKVKAFAKDFMHFKTELADISLKPVFRLKPPSKGYEREGIKKPYSVGGSLGYRGDKINDLLGKMT